MAPPKMTTAPGAPIDPFSSPRMLPVLLADYSWVIVIYATLAFCLAVLIDGHILPRFDAEATRRESTPRLALQVLLQIALQGFVAVVLSVFLKRVPSPLHGVLGYDTRSPAGEIIRNPAIISVVLFALSKSLQGRLEILFGRFDTNAAGA